MRSGGNLAVAFRKENPQLREAVNTWLGKHGKGDGFRNVDRTPLSQSVKYVKNAAADAERQKLQAVVELFKKYGEQYHVDYLLMAAQGYQESTLDQNVKSPVGAIGVMQVMPPTGKELNVGDITEIEPNIHAGVKYMRFMVDQYYKDEPMDDLNKALMTFASYNAGPGRIATAPARDGEAGPRSQRVVRQRRARRVGADRTRNGHLRQQHLQVLHHLPAAQPISRSDAMRRRRRSRSANANDSNESDAKEIAHDSKDTAAPFPRGSRLDPRPPYPHWTRRNKR